MPRVPEVEFGYYRRFERLNYMVAPLIRLGFNSIQISQAEKEEKESVAWHPTLHLYSSFARSSHSLPLFVPPYPFPHSS
jgi:hypothetical protein